MKKQHVIRIWVLLLFLLGSNFVIVSSFQIEQNDPFTSSDLSFDFIFDAPVITTYSDENKIYNKINIAELPLSQDKNHPMLPLKPLKILLPFEKTVQDISIKITSPSITYYDINPQNGPQLVPNTKQVGQQDFNNEQISHDISELYSISGIHNFRGFPILFINIHPAIYQSDTKSLTFYPSLQLHISTTDDASQKAIRYTQEDVDALLQMIDNPKVINSYFYQSGFFKADADAEYLIITSEQLKNSGLEDNFYTLMNVKNNKGISTKIVTVEEILADSSFSVNGSWGDNNPSNPFYQHTITSNISRFDDTAARIRNYIRYAYMHLGTRYVLLGGDADTKNPKENIIPVRGLFANESGLPLINNKNMADEEEADIPSDIYYACLDGSFNFDMDDHFGESPDRNNLDFLDEADLVAEVYVGRVPVDSELELAYFISKNSRYEFTQHPYLSNILFAGEYLGFPGISEYGGNYKDLIKPYIPEDYQVTTLYDRDLESQWNKFDLIEIINNATPHIINHDGHAYYGYNLKMHNSDVDYLTNAHPFFVYSHGCMAGGFDNPDGYDCIAEKLTVETVHGAFAVIMNARYGLGSENSLDSPSNALDISLFKALFTENIRELGRANHYSKEDHIWHINDNGIRWVYYQTNLIGDPQIQIKNIDPNPADIEVEIIKPVDEGCIYLKDKKLCSLFFLKQPIIIGGISCTADVITDPPGRVYKVEFLINDQQYHIDYKEPYTYHLKTPLKGIYTISVIAHGYYGEHATDTVDAKFWISSYD